MLPFYPQARRVIVSPRLLCRQSPLNSTHPIFSPRLPRNLTQRHCRPLLPHTRLQAPSLHSRRNFYLTATRKMGSLLPEHSDHTSSIPPDIPKMQWAQVAEKTGGPVVYKQIPVAEPGPDEVLVNVKYSGVCHTDLHAIQGDWPLETKLPLVGGHEGAGIVVACGSLVSGVQIGEKVGIKWLNGSCLSCSFCEQADEPLCAKALLSGYTVDGTFQQYAIAKAAHVAHLHPDTALDQVAPVLCAGITVYKGLKESGIRPGQTVAIVGAGGGLGSLACQYAKAMGLNIIAIDAGDEKRAMTAKLGAQTFVDYATSKDIVADVKAATEDGLGPHAVLLVAVSEKPFQQAADYVRPRGVVVLIGMPAGAFMKASVFSTVVKMITIKGSYVGNRRDTAEALEFYRNGQITVPIKVIGMSELQKVYDMMRKNEIVGRYVVDTSK